LQRFAHLLGAIAAFSALTLAKVREDWFVGYPRQMTARSRLAATLVEEILNHPSEASFAIASEHELCRRFNISRVTVRLALSDLEARGLIFRRHGKGTFAYGSLNRIGRSIGVLLKALPTVRQWPVHEMIRGLQWGASPLRTNILLTHAPPQEWSSEMIRSLGGVLVFPSAVTVAELDFLGQMKVPTLLAWETHLRGQSIDFGQAASARVSTERLLLAGHDRIAFISGFEKSLDERKRTGVLEAWKSVGKSPEKLIEFAVGEEEQNMEEVFTEVVRHSPNFSAVIAADDGIATRFVHYLHSYTAIRVPQAMSVSSFHRSPFLRHQEPALSTVDFPFFEAGKRAADSLSRAFLSGKAIEDMVFPGKTIEGDTIGRRSSLKRSTKCSN
jgi:GntR family transcriptional regulator of arabinose operon